MQIFLYLCGAICKTMRRISVFLSVLLMFLAMPLPSWAWGKKGHRIIAEVAYRLLSPQAVAAVDSVLGEHGMVWWANWPDEIKSDTVFADRYDWHFQDLAPALSDEAVLATLSAYPSRGGRLWMALDSVQHTLARNPSDRVALIYLVHLVGDAYCPMHIAHEDDLGGNRVRMQWFGNPVNLHSVWDDHLIESVGYSYSEYAAFLLSRYAAERQTLQNASRGDLLLRTYRLTESIYDYQCTFDGNTWHYIYHWHEPCEHQLFTAAVRLAMCIERLYKR